jgi:hypothetical protein
MLLKKACRVRVSSLACAYDALDTFMHSVALQIVVIVGTLLPTTATAIPITFTDRAAFDAYVGSSYTLLTLDAPDPKTPSEIQAELALGRYVANYSGLFSVNYDAIALGGIPGQAGLGAGGGFFTVATTKIPVTAFGFDILGTCHDSLGSCTGSVTAQTSFGNYELVGLNFLGWVSDTPFLFSMNNIPLQRFDIDNIRMVPEPSALLFLGCGLAFVVARQFLKHSI